MACPDWMAPMLATLTEERFSRDGWIFEPKFDGERCLAFRSGARVRLFSRNRKPLDDTYPELVEALLRRRQHSFVVDGEVVAFDERGLTSFARLQQRMQIHDAGAARRSPVRVSFYLFDLLCLDGSSTIGRPLVERKELLRRSIAFHEPLRFTEHRERDGEAYYREACKQGLEGVIAKCAGSRYAPGRSRDWLKFKCVRDQEFVIGGWTDPQGSRVGLGALLVGYYGGGKLRYAGKVGTGFDTAMLRTLARQLRALETGRAPFADASDLPRQGAHWARPELVAQIGFTEWTADGKLRHPRFAGLRDDKDAREVVREG